MKNEEVVDRMCDMAQKVRKEVGKVTSVQFSNRFLGVLSRPENPLNWPLEHIIELWVQECWKKV